MTDYNTTPITVRPSSGIYGQTPIEVAHTAEANVLWVKMGERFADGDASTGNLAHLTHAQARELIDAINAALPPHERVQSEVRREFDSSQGIRWEELVQQVMNYHAGCDEGKKDFLDEFVPDEFIPATSYSFTIDLELPFGSDPSDVRFTAEDRNTGNDLYLCVSDWNSVDD